ncbi:hypothetical protein EYF80_060600 [Liparis tanakae]|uniref:Uncharacterized protein n=1 Tax=Liparis tanakae TaxID=230148 RepID=A0A4Z2ELC7_9TELE|nr:hypothetical protein EYF80_060600 [Liparis tanakae]
MIGSSFGIGVDQKRNNKCLFGAVSSAGTSHTTVVCNGSTRGQPLGGNFAPLQDSSPPGAEVVLKLQVLVYR